MNSYDWTSDATPVEDVPQAANKVPFLVVLSVAVAGVLAFSATAPALIQRHAVTEFSTHWSEFEEDTNARTHGAIEEAYRLRDEHGYGE